MNPTITLAAVTLLAPAVGAVFVLWLCRRFLNGAALRGSTAIAFAAAFWLGYGLLAWVESRADFAPSRSWQWIPYATILAAAVGAVTAAVRVPLLFRWILFAATAAVSAWFIVPTWPDLEPSRATLIILLVVYFLLVTAFVEPLAVRLPSSAVAASLALSAGGTAALIAAMVSLTYGEAAAIACGALAGCAIAARLFPEAATPSALALVYAIHVGGWAFSGAIYPRPPLFPLMIMPLAPLALWVCAIGPLSRTRGIVATALQTGLVLAVLALGGGLAWFATGADAESGW